MQYYPRIYSQHLPFLMRVTPRNLSGHDLFSQWNTQPLEQVRPFLPHHQSCFLLQKQPFLLQEAWGRGRCEEAAIDLQRNFGRIVKLRERVREGLVKGMSPKGHL